MPILLALLLLFCRPEPAQATDLTVAYLERPPYYCTHNGRPAGFLLHLTQDILQRAGLSATFIPVPPNRILASLQANDHPLCTVGWFRTPERETYAAFSLPIYRDKPIVVLTSTVLAPDLGRYTRLIDLFADPRQTMAQVSSFSHGQAVDRLLSRHAVRTMTVPSGQQILPRLIAEGRATFMLIAPEEVETLLQASGLDPALFTTLPMDDAPLGNLRHLMFNKGIDPRILDRVNAAIAGLTDQTALSSPDQNRP